MPRRSGRTQPSLARLVGARRERGEPAAPLETLADVSARAEVGAEADPFETASTQHTCAESCEASAQRTRGKARAGNAHA